MSGKFKFFQGQGIVREFYVVSVKNGYLLKCQGNVREFYNFQFVSNDETSTVMSGKFGVASVKSQGNVREFCFVLSV